MTDERASGVSVRETTVLIVGAGPAGLTMALALAQYGVDHVVVERHPSTADRPRAHIVNQRTVEVIRHLGAEAELAAVAMPHESMRNRLWYTTLNRREVVRTEMWGTGPDRFAAYASASPCPMLNCPQTTFEPVLVGALRRAGSDVSFLHEFVSFERVDGGFVSTIRRVEDGSCERVRSRFIVGADGARSMMLELAGLELAGRAAIQPAINIWFRADLSRFLAHRPGVLSVNVHPGDPSPLGLGTLICCAPFDEFVLVRAAAPGEDELSMSPEDAIAAVHAVVGEPVDVELLGIARWAVNALVATSFGRDGVYCMGDAVHRHSPSSGMGLNMSVSDAFNLAWKLALVVRGAAGEGLLDTYDLERRPVDQAFVERAGLSGADSMLFRDALGLRPGMTEDEGWAALAELNQPGPVGDARRAAVDAALRLADYQFNGLAAEAGYEYAAGAIVAEPPRVDEPTITDADPDRRLRAALDYRPSTRPGARVPHARLERDGKALSSLDLVNGVEFGLFVGLDHAGWDDAAVAVSEEFGVAVVVHRIDGVEILDPYREWRDRREVGHDGAVLVRPDRHVAWRAISRPTDPTAALRDALRTVLCVDDNTLATTTH